MLFNHKLFLKVLLWASFLLMPFSEALPQDETPVKGNAVIFYIPQKSIQMNALAEKSAEMVIKVFNELGRFLPVERNRITWALKDVTKDRGLETYRELAERLEVDIYGVVTVFKKGDLYYAHMKMFPLSQEYKSLNNLNIIVNSKIITNIPLKLGREVAYLHKDMELKVKVTDAINEKYMINAGQWHGLKDGRYKTTDGGIVEINRTERYDSLATLPDKYAVDSSFSLKLYPEIKPIVKQIDDDIHYNTEYKYGLKNTLLKGTDPKKRYMQGICVINPGANFCLPIYGTHLSTRYLGFKKISPSIPGLVMTSSLFVLHFMLTPFITGFKEGLDQPKPIWDLQIFLWSTLPLTFTIGYLDQLAHQFAITEHLPPFFKHRNMAATVISLFVPGGGMFYKGYRLAGWTFYLAEMSLLGYAIYEIDNKEKSMYTFIALGCVKLIELLTTYFVKTSYDFYNFEKSRDTKKSSVSFQLRQSGNEEQIYALGIKYVF